MSYDQANVNPLVDSHGTIYNEEDGIPLATMSTEVSCRQYIYIYIYINIIERMDVSGLDY